MSEYTTYYYKPTKARARAGESASWGYRVPGGGATTGYASEADARAAMRQHQAAQVKYSSRARGMKMQGSKAKAMARVVGGRVVTG